MLIGSRLRLFVVFFTLAIAFITSNASANVLEGVRVWPSPDETRVVIDVQSEVSFTYFTLTSPERLVIDLKNTSSKSKLPMKVTDSDVLTKIRASSPPDKGTYRLVFELKKNPQPNYSH